MFKSVLLAAAVLTLASFEVAHATVTLQFSQTNVGRATGFADESGTPTNGMAWGIVVDGSGNGLQAGAYDPFDSSVSGFLSVGGIQTDDYYTTTGLLTSTQSPTGTDPGGVGGITSLSGLFPSYPTGVGVGDEFDLIWFESSPAIGTYYGTFSDASFVLPADGSTTSYAGVFAGSTADPAKPATHQFGVIPEPSRFVLLGLGAVGLFLRRRRQ